MKRVGVATVLFSAAIALGACSSSSSKSGSPASGSTKVATGPQNSSSVGTAPKASSGKFCDLITANDAAKLFGEAAIPTPNPPSNPLGGDQCIYQNKNRTASNPYWLLQAHHYTNPAYFDSGHVAHKTFTNLSGIGDAAFVSPDVVGTGYNVEVKKGSDVYSFDLNASNFGGPKPNVSKDALIAMVRSKIG